MDPRRRKNKRQLGKEGINMIDKKWFLLAFAVPIGIFLYLESKKPNIRIIMDGTISPGARAQLTVYDAPSNIQDQDLIYIGWIYGMDRWDFYVVCSKEGNLLGGSVKGAEALYPNGVYYSAWHVIFSIVDPSIPTAQLVFTQVPI